MGAHLALAGNMRQAVARRKLRHAPLRPRRTHAKMRRPSHARNPPCAA